MRTAAVLVGLVACGLLAGHAAAVSVPIPGVTTITVPTTALPQLTSTVTVPKLPPPPSTTLPKPLPTPTPPTTGSVASTPPAITTPTAGGSSTSIANAPSSGMSGTSLPTGAPMSSSSATAPSSGPSGTSTAAPSASGASLQVSRSWIGTKGPKARRRTILTFVLPRAARVVFTVRQVSPVCRIAVRFVVHGHQGVNRIRFPRPTSGLELTPGTYRISGHALRGRLVKRATIVVVGAGTPSVAQIAAARSANVCPTGPTAFHAGSIGQLPSSDVADPLTQGGPGLPTPQAAGPALRSGGVLGSSIEETARAIRPLLVGLLAFAIALLGIASLPRVATPESRAGDLLARHRREIAGLGTAALIAVLITFLAG